MKGASFSNGQSMHNGPQPGYSRVRALFPPEVRASRVEFWELI